MDDDLVQFLRARLDEDEAAAKAADGDEIEATPSLWGTKYLTLRGDHGARHTTELPAHLADHIARHDPARVLAEVEAKRELIDEVLGYEARIDGEWGVGEGVSPNTIPALRLLARPFRGHPDFDPAWLED